MSILNLLSLDFAAKVRWRMKYQKNPLFITLQDKYEVRQFAESKGVKVPELFYVTDRPEEIPFAQLPDRYLIKANHGCGWNILCYDSRFYKFGDGKDLVNEDGSFLNTDVSANDELSEAEVVEVCKGWLKSKYSKREWAYQHIPPKIVIEELLEAEQNQVLFEYKIFTFYGVPKAMFAASLKYRKKGERAFFDANFEEFDLTSYVNLRRPNPLPKKPARFSELLETARKLGEDIDSARIDLYDTADGIVLGEITLYNDAGNLQSPTACPIFNKWLGDQWVLSKADTRQASWLNVRFRLSRPILIKTKKWRRTVRPSVRLVSGKIKSCKKFFFADKTRSNSE